jgi:hypothetical protein
MDITAWPSPGGPKSPKTFKSAKFETQKRDTKAPRLQKLSTVYLDFKLTDIAFLSIVFRYRSMRRLY